MSAISVHKCLRCGHEWGGRIAGRQVPRRCPRCSTTKWRLPLINNAKGLQN